MKNGRSESSERKKITCAKAQRWQRILQPLGLKVVGCGDVNREGTRAGSPGAVRLCGHHRPGVCRQPYPGVTARLSVQLCATC